MRVPTFHLSAKVALRVFFLSCISQLMTVQIVVVFHLIAVVRIIFFARARAVTLENANLIVQVHLYKLFHVKPTENF